MSYEFKITSIDELITAASFADKKTTIFLTSDQLKDLAILFKEFRDDLNACHALLDKMGVPEGEGGSKGLVERLTSFSRTKNEKT